MLIIRLSESRFGVSGLCKPRYGSCVAGKRQIPIRVLDVAGLIPGASQGLVRHNSHHYACHSTPALLVKLLQLTSCNTLGMI
jgi:hypothetical protein